MTNLLSFLTDTPGHLQRLAMLANDLLWIPGAIVMIAIAWGIGRAAWRRAHRADDCVFCQIVARKAPATIVREWSDAIAIVPIDPVADGHVLVIPKFHVRDARVKPRLTGRVMRYAATLARQHHAVNIITSCGEEATQSIWHLHAHVAPRKKNDGLPLLWTGQVRSGQS